MSIIKLSMVGIALITLLNGCATISTLQEDSKNKIYSGTIRHFELGCAHAVCLDFPFSLIADTVLLPYTIPRTIYNYTRSQSGVYVSANERVYEVSLLKWLDNADPAQDAQSAMEKHDYRLRALYGYTLIVPCVDSTSYSQYEKKYGFNPIEGTSDALKNDEHIRLNKRAYNYASEYNKIILKNAPK